MPERMNELRKSRTMTARRPLRHFRLSNVNIVGAQQDRATERVRIGLGNDKSNPGGQAFVPIVFSPSPGIQVRALLIRDQISRKRSNLSRN